MDGKPLLQDRPPPYSPYGPAGNYPAHTYGAIPPAPPYPFPAAGTGPGYTAPAASQPHNYPNTTVGVLEDTFTCLGILCAILFFPIGIIFCLALRQRTCPNCGATFG
ncbi:hypothetical protein Chor_015258 [Crotalus horridus]